MKHQLSILVLLLWASGLTAKVPVSAFQAIPEKAKSVYSDEVFLRRTYLVLTGRLPEAKKAEQFLTATQQNKRALLVDSLLDSEAYVRYMVMCWGDILRIKSEFPSNLWPNGVQAYNRWLYEQISANVPYHQFVRNLLLSSGSNFRSPAVNFYRAFLKKTPENIYQNINLIFLGTRNCTDEGSACFNQIRYKATKEWKEEIIYIDTDQKDGKMRVKLSDHTVLPLKDGEDRRKVYVDWLTHPDNHRFAAVMANRLWFRVFGKGIVNEPDDWGPHNPPSDPVLLDSLTRFFIATGYDTKAFLKKILNSEAYQADGYFVAQRLPAEVLIDALADVTGLSDEYRSRVPEPFTFYPVGTRAVDLGDGTVSSSALELFGRVSRDVSMESQRNNTLYFPSTAVSDEFTGTGRQNPKKSGRERAVQTIPNHSGLMPRPNAYDTFALSHQSGN